MIRGQRRIRKPRRCPSACGPIADSVSNSAKATTGKGSTAAKLGNAAGRYYQVQVEWIFGQLDDVFAELDYPRTSPQLRLNRNNLVR